MREDFPEFMDRLEDWMDDIVENQYRDMFLEWKKYRYEIWFRDGCLVVRPQRIDGSP